MMIAHSTSAITDRAAGYDAWYATPLGSAAHEIELAVVEELAGPRAGETAVDVGCGTGIYTAWLAARGLDTTGVDRDEEMLAAARRRAPGAHLVRGKAGELPFADATFDLTLAVTVLCFLSAAERREAVQELVRVTRPGGRVVIGELARLSLWAAKRRLAAWGGAETWRAAHFTSGRELTSLLRAAGAGPVTVRRALYLPPADWGPMTRHAALIERLGRPLGPFGAAFVAVRAGAAAGWGAL